MDALGLVIVTESRTEHAPEPFPSPQPSRHTRMFLKGRERRESDQGRMAVIAQPDLHREVWLEMQTHTFTVRPILELATSEEKQRWLKRGARYTRQHEISNGKRVTYDIFVHTEKMEETAEFFGFPARHYVTHRRDVHPENTGKAQESVTDGWYLDFRHPAMPEPYRGRRMAVVYTGDEQPVIHRTGEPHYSGMPAKVVTTNRQTYRTPGGSSERTSKQTVEIVSLTEGSLDPALFEVPEDFRERPVFPSLWSDYARQFQKVLHRMRAT